MTLLSDVNETDLVGAIRLGCAAMARVFNADDPHGVAFFDAVAWPEPRLAFSDVHSEAHVPGRHLNALLAAEGLAGVEIDEQAVPRHRAALLMRDQGLDALVLAQPETITWAAGNNSGTFSAV